MKRIAIYGAGGFGKEVRGMVDQQPLIYTFAGYFDDFKERYEKVSHDLYDDVLMSIADPAIREKIVQGWSGKSVPFSYLVSPDVTLHSSVTVGRGCIICPGVKCTVDISIGQFSIVNLNATIGHDVVLGDFCSIMPSVNLSGNVTLGQRVFIGTGATILQGITIGDDAIVGAGAVVTHHVGRGKTVMGVPAREMAK